AATIRGLSNADAALPVGRARDADLNRAAEVRPTVCQRDLYWGPGGAGGGTRRRILERDVQSNRGRARARDQRRRKSRKGRGGERNGDARRCASPAALRTLGHE